MKFHAFLKELQKKSRLHFTFEEAVKATKSSKGSLSAKIYHLKKKGTLISPFKGLYIIIPLAYKDVGSLNPKEVVTIAMEFLQAPYYVGLLTAARHHGATHQGLFVFQVVSSKRIKKEIISGDTSIQFIYKRDIAAVETKKQVVDAGYLPISTPEETAKDVITYYRQCGGLNHQATVLAELTAVLNSRKLVALAKRSGKFFWVQRMGYILEHIDTFYEKERDRVILSLEKFLQSQKLRYVPLAPEMPTKGKPHNRKWKIIENATVESDI